MKTKEEEEGEWRDERLTTRTNEMKADEKTDDDDDENDDDNDDNDGDDDVKILPQRCTEVVESSMIYIYRYKAFRA